MNGYKLKVPKFIENTIVNTYQKIEDSIVDTYKNIENGVVNSYKKIESKFVDTFLEKSNQQDSEGNSNEKK